MSKENAVTTAKIYLIPGSIAFLAIVNYLCNRQTTTYIDELLLFLFSALAMLAYIFIQYTFLKALNQVAEKALLIAQGDVEQRIEEVSLPQLAQIGTVINSLAINNENATEFIKSIKEGNLEAEYNTSATEKNGRKDVLATTLTDLRDHLKNIANQEQERNWATEGLAKFVYILRANNEEITTLGDQIITSLVKYVNANQGGLFVVNEEDGQLPQLELVSCHAYNRKKYIEKTIQPGQGLIGQAYLEKDTIYITEVPEDYVHITSGLGLANPKSILIVPLKVNDQVLGVVELASFQKFQKYQIEFIEKLGESIASTISNAKVNERTKKLLEESQQQSEQMRAQEEEMRQNMEELHATQEDLQRKNSERQQAENELTKARNYLHSIINKISSPILVKDRQHRLILVNDAFCAFAGMKREQLVNKADHDLFPKEQADIFYEKDEVVFNSGEENVNIESNTDSSGIERTVLTRKTTFTDESGEVYLVATITDITDKKQTEEALNRERQTLEAIMLAFPEASNFKKE
ncbi:PAS domain S-box protein [Rhodocytophaga aerolata]|uniref:PAS domain S-box protein n=1 Tax=Rhodocytophaga aerolata TaxID=455078 RepID=A0ABT8R4N9_9BACT|nr:GAF domain-containing protein [Rhodocytophaga aerolata]MDO1446203.1 PAS domain S-box protein [Rhodocytophaga aerolata]